MATVFFWNTKATCRQRGQLELLVGSNDHSSNPGSIYKCGGGQGGPIFVLPVTLSQFHVPTPFCWLPPCTSMPFLDCKILHNVVYFFLFLSLPTSLGIPLRALFFCTARTLSDPFSRRFAPPGRPLPHERTRCIILSSRNCVTFESVASL